MATGDMWKLGKEPTNPEAEDVRDQYTIRNGGRFVKVSLHQEQQGRVAPTSGKPAVLRARLESDPMVGRTGDNEKLSKGIATVVAEAFDTPVRYSMAREKLKRRIRVEGLSRSAVFEKDPDFFVDDWASFLMGKGVLEVLPG